MKVKSENEVAQSCPTLSDPMNYSPPGSSVHGIFQARVLEWGAKAMAISQNCRMYPITDLGRIERIVNISNGLDICTWQTVEFAGANKGSSI